jgi:nucleoside-diphosphate-sugar epimerase
VTGGAGFIGGHVCAELAVRGHEPVVFDRSGRGDGAVMLGDVRDATAVTELAAHVDGIIHLSGLLGTQEMVANPRPAVDTNICGGINVLEAAAQYRIPVVVPGVGNHFMDNTYAITKTTIERFAAMYARERGVPVNVVRMVNAYGPGQSVSAPYGPGKVRKIVPAFVCRVLTGAPVEVYGDGGQVSDMVWVGDAARALVSALERAAAGVVFDRVVECGPAQHATVMQVAQSVCKAAAGLGFDPPEIVCLLMRPGETSGVDVTADSSTLELVGMDPATLRPLEDGLAETVAWYVRHWLPTYLRR